MAKLKNNIVWSLRKITTDVYFVGFPKVGNTWQRYLLSEYVKAIEGINDPNILLFDEYFCRGIFIKKRGGKGIQFTHYPLVWTAQTCDNLSMKNVCYPFRKKKVILLVRDLIDVMISWYHHCKAKQKTYFGSLEDFCFDSVLGLPKAVKFYNLWAAYLLFAKNILLVKYEDRHKDDFRIQKKIITFIGLPYYESFLKKAIKRASFENMRKLEKEGGLLASSGFNIFGPREEGNPNSYHVRRGVVGGYREEMPPVLQKKAIDFVSENLNPIYGYIYK